MELYIQGLIKDGEEMNQKFAYLLAEVEEGAINVFGSKAVNLRTVDLRKLLWMLHKLSLRWRENW